MKQFSPQFIIGFIIITSSVGRIVLLIGTQEVTRAAYVIYIKACVHAMRLWTITPPVYTTSNITMIQLTHIIHIQVPMHTSQNFLTGQWTPSQAERTRMGATPISGRAPIIIATMAKHSVPKLFRMWRWMKLNLLLASPGARGGFWVSHTSTTGGSCSALMMPMILRQGYHLCGKGRQRKKADESSSFATPDCYSSYPATVSALFFISLSFRLLLQAHKCSIEKS